jgi:hypothetical protein
MNLTPDDIAYLRQQAASRGMNADDLLKVINYESSGRPDVWGGKGNKYFGLLQFGGPERAQFGVDAEHPNARNQIDAGFKYLEARGFKPQMGLLDLYSTVNAGSPGHYNASDRPGATVASHVAKMLGMAPAGGSGAPVASPSTQSAQIAQSAPMGLLAASDPIEPEQQAMPSPNERTSGLLSQMLSAGQAQPAAPARPQMGLLAEDDMEAAPVTRIEPIRMKRTKRFA